MSTDQSADPVTQRLHDESSPTAALPANPTYRLLQKPIGAQGRNRTTDTAIFSRMLYQLSYLGAGTR